MRCQIKRITDKTGLNDYFTFFLKNEKGQK